VYFSFGRAGPAAEMNAGETMNFDPKMAPQEHVKQARDGLAVWDDIFRYAQSGFASISKDDFLRMRWFGIYQQRPNEGHFMWRIKIPGGRLRPHQLREIGRLAERCARGFGDITTRQDIQLHWLRIEDFPDAIDAVYRRAGLYTQFACGDCPRNITSCPLDDLAADQVLLLGDLVQRVSDMYRDGGTEFSNLPRKFKPSIAACPLHCHLPQINCVSTFLAARQSGGNREYGLGVMAGGGLSDKPHFAQSLRVFIPAADIPRAVPAVFRAVAHIFRDADQLRYKRGHARLKFLVAERGWQWFRDELEKRLGQPLAHDDAIVWPEGAVATDHMGIQRQRNGLYCVGVPVPCGRCTAAQMIALADLAERFAAAGDAEIRLSFRQNAFIANVPQENLPALCDALAAIGLPHDASPWRQALIACTGRQFCNLAVVETKDRARAILDYLEKNAPIDVPLMVSVTGCPNSCAQHHIADIGLTGIPVVLPDKRKVDGFNVLVGGRLGAEPRFAREIARKVPGDRVHHTIAALARFYMANRRTGPDGRPELFADFVARTPDTDLSEAARTPA